MDDRDSQGTLRFALESRTRDDFKRITAKAERAARAENALWLGVLAASCMCVGALAMWSIANATGICT